MVVSRLAEFQRLQRVPNFMQVSGGDPAEHDVLFLGGAGLTAGVLADDVGQPAELGRVEIAANGFDINDVVVVLTLGFDVAVQPRLVGWIIVVAVGGGGLRRGMLGLDVLGDHERTVVNGADVGEFGVDHGAEFIQADLVDQDLQPGHHAVLAQDVGVVEHRPDGQGHTKVVVLGHPLVEGLGQPGHDGRSTAAVDLESLTLLAVNLLVLRHEG